MSTNLVFTKENLDMYLSRLAKEFRKLNGTKIPAEIILVGGASVLANYGFRDMTYDIDAIIQASSSMKEAINIVGDELGLPNGWLNSDFTKTRSYSSNLLQYSRFYKRFGYILEVRTVASEYLIAMKLMSGRKYKNDISDIVGILKEEKDKGNELTLSKIQTAVCNLYGNFEALPTDSIDLISNIIKNNQLDKLYEQYKLNERVAKETLIEFEDKYSGVANNSNVDDIIKQLQKRKENK